ncbi:MAG: phosphoribosylamine--glycine ligase [Candidatus Krumholzibacteriia bacterium]|jgi:phosphoribosylamine--glycine ligase
MTGQGQGSKSVLVVGSGGREHAIARQLAKSPQEPKIYAGPGNPGTAEFATNVDLDPMDSASVVRFCRDKKIDLVIIGPEDPLIAGLADQLHKAEIAVFGPGAMGAKLEGDKEFAKEVLASAGVPTPHYHAFSSTDAALQHLDQVELPVVIKATGAAQGKGVAVCSTRKEAAEFIAECLDDQRFGGAGLRILMETCIFGPELSVLIVTDGQDYCLLAPSRDHKRIGEQDTGPNTGGMGAFAPVELPLELYAEIDARVVLPTLAELRRRDIPFRGVLYAGIMLTESGPQVLEFNCRFGDPETQVVLPLLRGDFFELCLSTAQGLLGQYLQGFHEGSDGMPADWAGAGVTRWDKHCVVVVGAADGYPGHYDKGRPLTLPSEQSADQWLIQAGTLLVNKELVTNGGRVLGAVGMGDDLSSARAAAYGILEDTHFEGLTFRRDIGATGE